MIAKMRLRQGLRKNKQWSSKAENDRSVQNRSAEAGSLEQAPDAAITSAQARKLEGTSISSRRTAERAGTQQEVPEVDATSSTQLGAALHTRTEQKDATHTVPSQLLETERRNEKHIKVASQRNVLTLTKTQIATEEANVERDSPGRSFGSGHA